MNKGIKEADFYQTFPPALKRDVKMTTLGRLIAEELHITANEAEKNIIYANIDNLSEKWLDVLAYDLHVDWYNYDYPIEAKRAIIKDSVRVHQKLGTKAAVERALGGIHPLSEIEEWFDYNGKPYHFRIVLDTTKSRVQADYDEIIRTVDIYKRLTAHLDGLYYQCSISVIVMPSTEYFIFSTPMTGQLKAGTYSYRNIEGGLHDGVIIIQPTTAGYKMEAVRTGTKPDRNIIFEMRDNGIVTESDTENIGFNSNMTGKEVTGTNPYKSVIGGIGEDNITATIADESYKFESDLAGTKPDRNITFEIRDNDITTESDTENFSFDNNMTGKEVTGKNPNKSIIGGIGEDGITATAAVESYKFDSDLTGTKPDRNTMYLTEDVAAVGITELEVYKYDSYYTGTKPRISTNLSMQDKGVTQVADTENYTYEVKRCGASKL